MASSDQLKNCIRRQEPVLVAPASPTPHEWKQLSDIDDQQGLRFHVPVVQFYRVDPHMEGRDPAAVIRNALSRSLVPYYPLAGRLRKGAHGKLVVECNGEGILFIEADADVKIAQFREALKPPFLGVDGLLCDVPGSDGIVDCPLLLIQVTRLACGGFIVALRANHLMCDAAGGLQFLTAVGELARGAAAPAVQPVWQRELLNARDPPRVTCVHPEYDELDDHTVVPFAHMAQRIFFLSPTDVSSLRQSLPPHLRTSASTFDIIAACTWRCRSIALRSGPEEQVRMIFAINARGRFSPPLPAGYYGNVVAFPMAITTAGKLTGSPLGYAVEMVKKAKKEVTEEYMRSVADLLVIKGRPRFTTAGTFIVSDHTRARLGEVDYGWGRALYAGALGATPGCWTFFIPFRNEKGEDGIAVPVYLPAPAMQRFTEELHSILNPDHRSIVELEPNKSFRFIRSMV